MKALRETDGGAVWKGTSWIQDSIHLGETGASQKGNMDFFIPSLVSSTSEKFFL